MSQVFRNNQIVVNLDQTEVATLLNAIRSGYIFAGKTADSLTRKLQDALISAGRDPAKFGFEGPSGGTG
jgi:hypothetical protein